MDDSTFMLSLQSTGILYIHTKISNDNSTWSEYYWKQGGWGGGGGGRSGGHGYFIYPCSARLLAGHCWIFFSSGAVVTGDAFWWQKYKMYLQMIDAD